VTGGAAPYTWSTTPSPIVPSALTINATTGVISGVVSGNAGNYSVVVKATDKNGRTATFTSNITITNPALLWVTAANLPDGYEKTNYSTMVSVSGVTPPYLYSLTGGTLPNNLTLNGTTGVISGNLTTAGNYTFSIRAQDACGRVADRSFTLRVGKNGILECLKEIWVDVDYDNITYTGHTCNDADFQISLMSTNVMIANLNNVTGAGTLVNGVWLHRNYMNYPQNTWPNTFRGVGNATLGESSSSYSRYNRVLIDTTLLESVASSYNGSTTVPIYATNPYPDAGRLHGDAARLRVYTNKTRLGFANATQVHDGPIKGGVRVLVNLQCPSSTTPALQLMAIPSAASKSFAVKMLVVDPTGSLTNVSASDHTKAEHLVAAPFLIGRTEATNQEYCEFLNAVAKQSDPRGLYNAAMSSDLNGGIERSGNAGAYAYSVKAGMGNFPVVHVSWFDAVRYVNWLSNGSPTGAQDKTTTEDGAYALNGAVSGVGIARNATNPNTIQKPKYWLLNEGEWHASAYSKTSKQTAVSFWSYPTQSDADPDLTLGNIKNLANCGNIFTGPTEAGFFGESYGPFGTLDQGGNVREWTESVDSGQYRIIRGGSWADSAEAMKASESDVADPTLEDDKTGFRIGGAP
jgi:formylglycine-generating enzyme required for sulfatase activity